MKDSSFENSLNRNWIKLPNPPITKIKFITNSVMPQFWAALTQIKTFHKDLFYFYLLMDLKLNTFQMTWLGYKSTLWGGNKRQRKTPRPAIQRQWDTPTGRSPGFLAFAPSFLLSEMKKLKQMLSMRHALSVVIIYNSVLLKQVQYFQTPPIQLCANGIMA